MRILPLLAASAIAALLAASAAPAGAATACAEHIDTIERRLQSEGAVTVTGNTTGEPVVEGSEEALATPPPEASATDQATSGGAPTPERIAAARVLIVQARELDGKGDLDGCNGMMTVVKELIGPLP